MKPLAAVLILAGFLVAAGGARASTTSSFPVSDVTLDDVELAPGLTSATAQTAWCGTAAEDDRVPNVGAGNAIHWVYAIPSDGADGLTELGSVMQSDADQIDAWWRGQDATRVPRNDLATFSCGAQLDITLVRLSESTAQLSGLEGRFSTIVRGLQRAGLDSTYAKYVVYYDGQTSEGNICGQGGSDGSGFGVAIVYYRSCTGVSTAAVAVHEFLHTVGAVPRAAPNDCEGESSGHVCDDERDLMYPSIGDEGLAAKILDLDRNDYYGHPGGWTDTRDSAWLVWLDAQTPLALSVSGAGSVSSDVPGLLCGASCTTTWNAGQRLALTATPAAGARFVGWRGACTGSAGCQVSVNQGAAVTAVFAPVAFRLRVVISGRGTVKSSQAGITCRPRCSASFPSFSAVRLTATPAKGWKLRSWTGACTGSKRACTVPMSAATSARAIFVRS